LLLFYGLFFFVGAVRWESRDRAGLQVRHWAWKLLLALAVLLPVGLWLARAETMGPRRLSWLLQIGYVWLMCDGMMGLFQRFIRAEHKAIRYLADASYWMYLIHLPLVILAQHWVRHWPQPAMLKFAMLFLLVFALCLLTYRLFVRHTRIGHLLNGKRN
jgi:peptidoglycan/LPS O-acetylase OafA/YrhL